MVDLMNLEEQVDLDFTVARRRARLSWLKRRLLKRDKIYCDEGKDRVDASKLVDLGKASDREPRARPGPAITTITATTTHFGLFYELR